MKNEIIIIGGNHHNLLGMVRSFGERNFKCNVIITNDNRYAYVKRSKYINKCFVVHEDEKEIMTCLDKFSGNQNKPIIFPTSDFSEAIIDKNFNAIKSSFILPSINNKQGQILKFMNKFNQFELAKKNDIKMAKSKIIELNDSNIKIQTTYPCIIKPLESIDGQKSDITICYNNSQLKECFEKLRKCNYKKLLIQDYINYDYELTLMGCSYNKRVYIPGAVKKFRRYPTDRGSVSFGEVIPYNYFSKKIINIEKLLIELNYNGLFDIEIFVRGSDVFLNEINFRNSGNSYVLNYKNISLGLIWAELVSEISNNIKIDKAFHKYYIRDEFLEKMQLKEKIINYKEYNLCKKKSSISFVYNKKDFMPIIWKYIYAVLRRIDKNGM